MPSRPGAGDPPLDLRLRRAEPADHVAVAGIMSMPQTYSGTLQQPFASVEQWRERMAKHDPQHFQIVAEVRTRPDDEAFTVIGHLGLIMQPQQRRSHVAVLGIAIRDDWQGRGVGSTMMAAAIDRADNWMNILRIELIVFAGNEAAIALYRRHGFVVEGTHRAHALRDGVYADALTMARLHPAPPRLPASSARA